MNIHDVAGFSKPITKLIEVVSKGIGEFYEPTNIRRKAKARADEIKIISDAIENTKLPITYNGGKIKVDSSSKELLERTEKRLLLSEVKKQKNIEDIIRETYTILDKVEKVSDDELQDEWIDRFFSIAGEVSSDELKIIWSKILSEEIKQPGKCSIRTLECLKNISKEEAAIFMKISNCIIKYNGIYFLPNSNDILNNICVGYGDIIKLDEASLINSLPNVGATFTFNTDGQELFMEYSNRIICCTKKDDDVVNLEAFVLTGVGKNIYDILSTEFDSKFYEKYIDIIKKKMNVTSGEIIEKYSNGKVKYKVESNN